MFEGLTEILFSYFNVVQTIGFLALLVGLYAFTRKSDSQLKMGQAAQNFLLALHFYLLGASSAAAMSLLTGVRNSISLYRNVRHAALLFIGIYLLVGFFAFEELVDILPITSALLGTTAVFYLSGIKMRLVMMLSTSLWIIHNAVVVSIGPLLMEIVILSVTARTTYELWKSDK